MGAHTDSPNLSVRPNPSVNRFGCNLAVDVYGGALLNPWFDRDLSMAGKVSFETGTGADLSTDRFQGTYSGHHRWSSGPDANKGRTVNPRPICAAGIAKLR